MQLSNILRFGVMAVVVVVLCVMTPGIADGQKDISCVSNAQCTDANYACNTYLGKCECRWGKLEVGLPGGDASNKAEGWVCDFASVSGFGELIDLLVVAIIALVVMASMVTIVIGGYLYMTAMGNADRVRQAKVWIGSALLGIFLALAAYAILNFINPDLVRY